MVLSLNQTNLLGTQETSHSLPEPTTKAVISTMETNKSRLKKSSLIEGS